MQQIVNCRMNKFNFFKIIQDSNQKVLGETELMTALAATSPIRSRVQFAEMCSV